MKNWFFKALSDVHLNFSKGFDRILMYLYRSQFAACGKNVHFYPRESYFYYKTIEIPPGEEHTFSVSRSIENVKEGNFNIHYFFLYKNDGENIYDTYYWARFTSKPFTINLQAKDSYNEKALRDSITFIDDHQSYNTYNEEKSLYVMNLCKSIAADFKNTK